MRIETYRFFGVCMAVGTCAALVGCSDSAAGSGTAGKAGASAATTVGSGTTTSGTTGTGGAGGGSGMAGPNDHLCLNPQSPPVAATSMLISDFDNEAGLGIQAITGPHGVWAMDVDLTPPPAASASFAVEPCGTTGNGLHFRGGGFTIWGADVAAAFISATEPADASKYQGISFVLKSPTPLSVIVKLTNLDSQPADLDANAATPPTGCGLCDGPTGIADCYSGYFKTVSSDATGGVQRLTWADFPKQTWGYHFPGVFQVEPSSLEGISFAVDNTQPMFDLCIDDVQFF